MQLREKDNEIEILITKIVIHSFIILLCLGFIILAPKTVFSSDKPFHLATSMAITDDENLFLFDYEVYSTEERFNAGLIEDVLTIKKSFYERNEILAVKVYGESELIEVKDDYIFITSPDTMELNIEYYLVKDMEFNNIFVPCRTFIMLFNDVSKLINTIYLAVFVIVSMSIIAPTTIKLTRNIVQLKKIKPSIKSDKNKE